MHLKNTADRIGGAVAAMLGVVALVEAVRLYPQRISDYGGDHLIFGLLGTLLVVLGLFLLFVIRIPPFPVEFPKGKMLYTLLTVFGLILVYRYLLPIAGYVLGTFFITAGLLKVMGSYSWIKSLLYAVLLTGSLYGVFVLWLQMSFPKGVW